MTEAELREIVENSVQLANEMSEMWVGTTTGRIIDKQKEHVQYLMKSNDFNLAEVAVMELTQTCEYAEKEIND